ncbi:MAG TPA: outer membrane beta-barrel protein [Vicinamibacterales bacterium]|nr:outer membrane beta-barrel protein [Vicinamibacterales bacterium]
MKSAIVPCILGVMASASPVLAQNVTDPAETARFRLGVLALTPRLGIRDLGVDTNIFNLAAEPRRDTTATFTAGADTWLRVGRAYLSGRTTSDWHYFKRASDQRSINVTQEGRLDLDLLRIVPRVGGAFINTRQRPNEEFDLRVQQRNAVAFGGVMVPIGTRTRVDFELRQQRYDYSAGKFGDTAVASALNRKSRLATVEAGVNVTPLTRAVLKTDWREDSFTYESSRDSHSVRVMPGVEMQPFALVSGKAFAGYRRFTTQSAAVPDVSGVVAAVELKYVAADVFRITGQLNRDLDYSLDLDESVYVSTSMGVEAVKAVGLYWDLVGRARRAALAYQEVGPVAGRTDRLWLVGGGLGRRLGSELRVGLDIDYVKRGSIRTDRTFDGLRFGTSVTYGY